tara:strand:+ start:385 stop:2052 length:1668 start_codon:yes stop_codon:yes gene_type:complete
LKKYSSQFVTKFNKARSFHKQGAFSEAERAYRSLLAKSDHIEEILGALTRLYLQTGRLQQAVNCLEKIIRYVPEKPIYYEEMVKLYDHMENGEKAASCYRQLLARQPHLADTHYNLGYLLKKYHKYEEAISAYQAALEQKIERPEEVYLNMAVIYSDHLRQEDKAKQALEKALDIKPDYVSAMFNLANILEEEGDRKGAEQWFSRTVEHDPTYDQALARLGEVKKFAIRDDPVIGKIRQAVEKPELDVSTRTNLYFSLGKALNQCGSYDEAFSQYEKANRYNMSLVPAYDRTVRESITDDLISFFSREWFAKVEPVSDAAPIFICGMFRSGSTLAEQIMASHSEVTAGGEVDFFVRKVRDDFSPFPTSLHGVNPGDLKKLAQEYLRLLSRLFPNAQYITDKRPDNFLFLGLLKSLFPNVKIIYTRRNPLDNCLSVYFLRLGAAMNYATKLENIGHYYQECQRLMGHWQDMFGENIVEVNYDDLVKDPKPSVEKMLNFCGLAWEDSCLEFHKLDNVVKTASVWQVRQPLYQKSSGRWRNYEAHLGELKKIFNATEG